MNITLRQLRAFLAVHHAGSFTKAAHELHLTQSALSSLIKELESNLGMRLFDRTTRQLDISESGKNILPAAVRVLNEMNAMHDEIARLKNLEQGKVRIAITQQLASTTLPGMIADFNASYPNIKVSVIDCGVEMVQQCVLDATVDIGIGPERELSHGLTQELLFSLPFHIVAPPDHPLAKLTEVTWKHLKNEDLITLSGSFTELLSDDLLRRSAAHLLNAKYKVSFMSTALSMVQHGLGVTLCLPYVHEWVTQNKLLMLPIKNPEIHRKFYLYSRKNRVLSPAVEQFIKLFSSKIKSLDYGQDTDISRAN